MSFLPNLSISNIDKLLDTKKMLRFNIANK